MFLDVMFGPQFLKVALRCQNGTSSWSFLIFCFNFFYLIVFRMVTWCLHWVTNADGMTIALIISHFMGFSSFARIAAESSSWEDRHSYSFIPVCFRRRGLIRPVSVMLLASFSVAEVRLMVFGCLIADMSTS